MTLKKYFLYSAAAVACLIQASCEVSGPPVDLRYPSVADLDEADVRWGLQPRKAKGAPKRAYQYQLDESGGGGAAPAASAPVVSAPAPAPAAAPQATANPIPPAPDPQIDVNKLR